MTNAVSIIRGLLIYSVCVPVAILLGYSLANPLDYQTIVAVGIVLGVLLLPFLLKWHHPLLVLTWNTTTVLFILPGRPNLWMIMALLSLICGWVYFILNQRVRPVSVPSVSRALLTFGAIIFATALLTGGAGFSALGSEFGGGKRYLALAMAIVGYFALSAQRIPVEKANLFIGLFFLSGTTQAIGSLLPYVPSSLYFIFWLFPVDRMPIVGGSVAESLSATRMPGVSVACMLAGIFMLARYGIRGIFLGHRPGRMLFFAALVLGSLFGGFRSYLLLLSLVFTIQFFLEGLHRTQLLPIFAVGLIALGAIALPFTQQLPYQVQRAISVLPVPVSPEVELDSRNSTEWRLKMWRELLPEVPQYLLVGKGYAINLRDLQMTVDQSARRELAGSEGAQLVGDYHNGPLSVIIPLGVFGVIALLWFWLAAIRVLLGNFRHGAGELKSINTLLLALFIAKVVHFLVIFGSLYGDLYQFTGIVGLSVALNGGLARPAPVTVPEKAPEPTSPESPPTPVLPRPRPAFRRTVVG